MRAPIEMLAKNSWRVRKSDRKDPRTAEVTVEDPAARTPRMHMHMCEHSTTTPTPNGSQASWTACAICCVSRSWTWSRRGRAGRARDGHDAG